MEIRLLFKMVTYAEPLFLIFALIVIARRGRLRDFGFLSAFLAAQATVTIAYIASCWLIKLHLLSEVRGYQVYFYTYLPGYILRSAFGIGLICLLFRNAMAPLPAMKKLGNIVFYWAGAFSGLVSICLAIGPRLTGVPLLVHFVAELQQTQSVMALALLLFICLAAKPLGISVRSKLVGVSMGFGVLAMTDLVNSAWMGQTNNLVNVAAITSGLAACVAATVWGVYFWIPEPKEKLILLPTNSSYHHWNQVSAVLNDPAGYVAVGEVTTAMFAPAELEVMRRASARLNDITVESRQFHSALQVSSLPDAKVQPYQRYRELTQDEWELVTR